MVVYLFPSRSGVCSCIYVKVKKHIPRQTPKRSFTFPLCPDKLAGDRQEGRDM